MVNINHQKSSLKLSNCMNYIKIKTGFKINQLLLIIWQKSDFHPEMI